MPEGGVCIMQPEGAGPEVGVCLSADARTHRPTPSSASDGDSGRRHSIPPPLLPPTPPNPSVILPSIAGINQTDRDRRWRRVTVLCSDAAIFPPQSQEPLMMDRQDATIGLV
ncbi:unnamed protein product [Pleuronectes platessa]|uniref:Uncharacterized protein n=1 Tax=Pleuronectes platessa TaxID=8262 RepID=A0A9N7YDW1_PLEPL|nr:unnamed protein product [Pleuronectes platessa]